MSKAFSMPAWPRAPMRPRVTPPGGRAEVEAPPGAWPPQMLCSSNLGQPIAPHSPSSSCPQPVPRIRDKTISLAQRRTVRDGARGGGEARPRRDHTELSPDAAERRLGTMTSRGCQDSSSFSGATSGIYIRKKCSFRPKRPLPIVTFLLRRRRPQCLWGSPSLCAHCARCSACLGDTHSPDISRGTGPSHVPEGTQQRADLQTETVQEKLRDKDEDGLKRGPRSEVWAEQEVGL